MPQTFSILRRVTAVLALSGVTALPLAAQETHPSGVILGTNNILDLSLQVIGKSIQRGKTCIGEICSASETFDPNTALKLRTSGQAWLDFRNQNSPGTGFVPGRDWRLRVNDGFNGGIERFSIEDLDAGTVPFSVEGGAPENLMWLDAGGRIGIGTMLPQTKLHVISTIGPSLRLEQSGNGLLPAQAWDVKGQTGFALLDVTAGTTPFRIDRTAPTEAMHIDETGDVGLGTNTPTAPLHVLRDSTTTPGTAPAGILIEDTGTNTPRGLLTLRNNGQVFFALEDSSIAAGDNTGRQWNFQNLGGEFRVTTAPGGGSDIEMRLDVNGNMTIEGNYFASSGQQLNVPDYVFAPDYDLKPLSEVQAFIDTHSHLPGVPSAADINETGLNMTDMQMRLLKKVEELTLYTLEQEAELAHLKGLEARFAAQEALLSQMHRAQAKALAQNAALAARLEALSLHSGFSVKEDVR